MRHLQNIDKDLLCNNLICIPNTNTHEISLDKHVKFVNNLICDDCLVDVCLLSCWQQFFFNVTLAFEDVQIIQPFSREKTDNTDDTDATDYTDDIEYSEYTEYTDDTDYTGYTDYTDYTDVTEDTDDTDDTDNTDDTAESTEGKESTESTENTNILMRHFEETF